MDVQLYVYDLSRGLARQLSGALLGTQIDAVYHTSLVFGGVEYFFGAGVQTSYPGSTHHGKPMEVVPLGTTHVDLDTILEYLDSLKVVYTAQSYDLFENNCNNFTNDFAMFLVGKGIPAHITSLPSTVLATPFGRMLKPQLDQAMRGFTQAPVAPSAVPRAAAAHANGAANGRLSSGHATAYGKVHDVSNLAQLDSLLDAARSTGAVIFFTSQTCPPCKICYPAYDSLAEEAAGKLTLIKVDTGKALDVSMRYQVRATPTFMTFLRGNKLDEWKGADNAALLGNVRLLMEMANPTHPHFRLNCPTLRKAGDKPVLYAKLPPLDKLTAQLGDKATDPAVVSLVKFVKTRSASGASDAALPNMPAISTFIRDSISSMEGPKLFPLVDLLRLALLDPRISGYFAGKESGHAAIADLLKRVTDESKPAPYSLQITTVQAVCNMFSSSLSPPLLLGNAECSRPLVALVATSLLDEAHAPLRVSAASLALNVASCICRRRAASEADQLEEELQVELAASIMEAVDRESNDDALRGLLLAIGQLGFGRTSGGELDEVFGALQAAQTVKSKKSAPNQQLLREVSELLSPA